MKNLGLFQFRHLNYVILLIGIILSAWLSFDITQEKKAYYDSSMIHPNLFGSVLYIIMILPFIACSLFTSYLQLPRLVRSISSLSVMLMAIGFVSGFAPGASLMQAALNHNPQVEYTDNPFDLFFIFYSVFNIMAMPFFMLALLNELRLNIITKTATGSRKIIYCLTGTLFLCLISVILIRPHPSQTIKDIYVWFSLTSGLIIIPGLFTLLIKKQRT